LDFCGKFVPIIAMLHEISKGKCLLCEKNRLKMSRKFGAYRKIHYLCTQKEDIWKFVARDTSIR